MWSTVTQCATQQFGNQVKTSLGNSGLYWTVFVRNRDTAVPTEGNGDLQTLIWSLRRDSDDVTHCRILSSDKAEWQRILATLLRCCFVADQLRFGLDLFCILLALVFNSVMYCITSTIVVAFETNISLSRDMHTRERRSDDDRPDMVNKIRVVGFSNLWVGESLCDGVVTASGSQWSVCHSWRTWSTTNDAWWLKWFCCHRTGRFTILRRQAASQFSTNYHTICHTTLAFNDWYRSVSRGNSDHTKLIMAHQ